MIKVYLPDQYRSVPAAPDFGTAQLLADQPDAHLAVERGGEIAARCSIWWQGTPTTADGVCGAIGHFHTSDPDACTGLLDAACDQLLQNGCCSALAPMNGNTWRQYRYATGGADRPPFLMEPPPALGRDTLLQQAGFAPINRYRSYAEALADATATAEILQTVERSGFRIRSLDLRDLRGELERVYALALLAFRENPHYTDLPREAFVRQYLTYREMLVPELVLLAYYGDKLAGFLFCIPDYPEDRQPPCTLLLKTVAVAPAYRSLGLGAALVALVRRRAADMGFTHAIEALIYRGNRSEKLCRAGSPLREYTLFGRML